MSLPRGPAAAPLGLALPLASLALLVLPALPAASLTESLGVSPADHDIDDALPRETYLRYVTIQNEFDSPSTITVEASGELADWLTVDPAENFPIGAREHREVELTVRVPTEAVNGTYEGRLHFIAEPKDVPEGSGASLRYAVGVPLTLHVGGDHDPEISFGVPTAADAEAGSAPRIQAPVANEGNARTVADACALVSPVDAEEPLQRIPASTLVLPGEQTTITFDPDPLARDRYRVELVTDCEPADDPEPIGATTFEVVPPGSLGKEARLAAIDHEPRVTVGRPVELTALLDNTGQTNIGQAAVTFRILQDGELLAVVDSPSLVAPAGETTELTAYYTPEEPGRYDVEALATYDGRQTEQRDSFFTAAAEAASSGPAASWLASAAPYLLAILLITLAAVAYWRVTRLRSATDDAEPTEALETADVEPLER